MRLRLSKVRQVILNDALGEGIVHAALWQAIVDVLQEPNHHRVGLAQGSLAKLMALGLGGIDQLLGNAVSLLAALVQAHGCSLSLGLVLLKLLGQTQHEASQLVILLVVDVQGVAVVAIEVHTAIVVVTVLVGDAAPAIVVATVPPAASIGVGGVLKRTTQGVLQVKRRRLILIAQGAIHEEGLWGSDLSRVEAGHRTLTVVNTLESNRGTSKQSLGVLAAQNMVRSRRVEQGVLERGNRLVEGSLDLRSVATEASMG